jgi:hypothetical protein
VVRTIAAAIYMLVWGIATVVLLIRGDPIPAEYWTLPAIGLGGLLTAISTLDNRSKRETQKSEVEPPKDEPVKETP